MEYLKNLNIDKIRNAAEDALNQAKPKTEVEARVYEALSHKNWGTSSTLMNEISRDTFDFERYSTVMKIMWESLQNQRPAAWRVVFKGMTLLEHLVKNGSERCVDEARSHTHILRTLLNFNYYEGTTDRGIGVREKAKQLVELLGDDERIREERTKAKQLREKFGGNLGGVSSSGGGGGSSYAGYGNDDYNSYSGGGGGSSSGGGYGQSGIGSSSAGFSGRYSDTNNETSSSPVDDTTNDSPAPTFAAVPDKKKKKSKKSKKKKEKSAEDGESEPAPAPAIDLLAFDEPAPASSFDAFQSADAPTPKAEATFDAFGTSAGVPTSNSFDAFGDMTSAPATQQQPQFDAFHSSAPVLGSATKAPAFDAFGTSTMSSGNNSNDMFGNNNMNTNNMFGTGMNGGMKQTQNNNIMGGSTQFSKKVEDDDDFGDFADGGNASKSNQSSDPLSNLISLDGLTKNKNNTEDKTLAPVVFNQAAKDYVNNKDLIQNAGTSKMAADIAFSGVDGLNKMSNSFGAMNMMGSNNQMGMVRPAMNSMNSGNNVMAMNNMMGSSQQQGMMNMNQMGMGNTNQMNGFMNVGMNNGNSMNSGIGGGMNFNMGQMSNNMGGYGGNNMATNNMSSMMGGQQGGNNMMGGMQGNNNKNNSMGGEMLGSNGTTGGQPMGGGMPGSNGMMGGQPMGGGW